MLILLILFIYLTLLFTNSGILTELLVKKTIKNRMPELIISSFFYFWIGLSLISISLGFIHFFSKIGLNAHLFILFFNVLLSCIFYTDIKAKWFAIIEKIKQLPWLYYLAFTFILIVIVIASTDGPIYNLDPARYHNQCLEWAKQYPLVPGIANLHVRFGSFCNWHLMYAFMDFGPFEGKSYHIFNGLILTHFYAFTLYHLFQLRKKCSFLSLFIVGSMLFFSYHLYFIYYWSLSCLTPDIAASLLSFIGFSFFMKHISGIDNRRHIIFLTMLLSIIVFTGFSFKMNGVFGCILFLYPFWKLFIKDKINFSIKELILICSIPLIIGGFRLIQSEITSGYMMFPITSLDLFSPDWQAKETSVHGYQIAIHLAPVMIADEPFSQEVIDLVNKSQFLAFWRWFKHQLTYASMSYFILALLSFIPLLCAISFKSIKPYLEKYFIPLIFSYVCLIFWFISAPDIRFGMQNVAMLLGFNLAFLIMVLKDCIQIIQKILFPTILVIFGLLSLQTFVQLTPISISKNHVKYPFKVFSYFYDRQDFTTLLGTPETTYKKVLIDNSFYINYPDYSTDYLKYGRAEGFAPPYFDEETINNEKDPFKKGVMIGENSGVSVLLWNTPLPATRSLYPGLEMRTDDIRNGYRINPTVRNN